MARRTKRSYNQAEEESIYGSDSIYAAPRDDDEYEDTPVESAQEDTEEEQKKNIFGKFFAKNNEEAVDSEQKEEESPSKEETIYNTARPLVEDDDSYEEEESDEDEKRGFPFKIVSIVAAIVIVVAAGAYFAIHKLGEVTTGEAYVQSVAVITGRGSANGMTNRYTGEVEPQSSWKIELNGDSTVEKCYVQVGSEVKKGDKLFKYDTEALQLNYEKQQLDIDTLENEQKELAKNIETYQKEYKTADAAGKIEYQTEILTAQAQIKKNEYSLKAAKDQLKKSKKTIQQATVKSKMDGVVKSINKKLGEGVDSSDDNSSDTSGDSSYMTILATGDFRVKGVINETNVYAINEGDPVIVRSRVKNDEIWTGVISKIKTDSTADEGEKSEDDFGYDMGTSGESTSQYNFYVTLTTDEGLLMGQHVFIELDQGQEDGENGLWLPESFLTVDGDHFYVWKDNKGKLKKVEVEVNVDNYNEMLESYEILSGISEDDYIALANDNNVDGQKTTKTMPVEENDAEEMGNEAMNEEDFGDEDMDEVMDGEPVEGDSIDTDALEDDESF